VAEHRRSTDGEGRAAPDAGRYEQFIGVIGAAKPLIRMMIKIIFMPSNVDAVKSIVKLTQIGVIVPVMNLFMAVEKCLSMIRAPNGLKANGNY